MKRFILSIIEAVELLKRRFVNPENYLPRIFKLRMGYYPDLSNPKTYSEKLQWLKLYYHNPLYTKLVDKYEVKNIVGGMIGSQYIIPTLGVWERFCDIDFDSLPEKFVLKSTHDSGGVVICKDKSRFDKRAARRLLKKSLRNNYYYYGFEWPYKNVHPRLIAEAYMEDAGTGELRDYKFFCFDGKVKALFIATDRQTLGTDVKFDFFDADYNHLPFRQGHENAAISPEKPSCFNEMKRLAETISHNMPHARVDFYEVSGKVYFGEITFFHHGGWTSFDPQEWDMIFGEWLQLPPKMC